MHRYGTLILIIAMIAGIITAGCVQASGSSPVPPAPPAADIPVKEPETPSPAVTTTGTPAAAATIVRYVYPPRDLREPDLLFTLQVPGDWNVSTQRLMKSDFSDYRTELVAGNVFSIYSYPAAGSREQEFREQFRQRFPATDETAVSINGIRYDRFEGKDSGNTTVAYIVRATSANERGYVSVLAFTARDSDPAEREDFERVVSTFRYFGLRSAAVQPGGEIPLYDPSGNLISRNGRSALSDSSDWDMGEGGSFDVDSQGASSSGSSGSGSSGGGCGRG